MAFYITRLYGSSDDQEDQLQARVAQVAGSIGISPIAIRRCQPERLAAELVAALQPLSTEEGLIVQLPLNDQIASEILLTVLDSLDKGKIRIPLVLFLHRSLFSRPGLLEQNRALLQRSAAIIVPDSKAGRCVVQLGVTDRPVIICRLLDTVSNLNFSQLPAFSPHLNICDPSTPVALNSWAAAAVPQYVYNGGFVIKDPACIDRGHFANDALTLALHQEGGFGLLLDDDALQINLGRFVTAGLPLVAAKSNPQAAWIHRYGLGWIVESPAAVAQCIRQTPAAIYETMAQRIEQFGRLSRRGYFLRRALLEGEYQALLAGRREAEQ